MTNLSGYAAKYEIIIAMPDAARSIHLNSATDPKSRFEGYLIPDFLPWVDKTFRTIPLPRARAVAGWAMGGCGAAFLRLKRYREFDAIGGFSTAAGFSRDPFALPAGTPGISGTIKCRSLSTC